MINIVLINQIPNLNNSIADFCFPDQSCQNDLKKNEWV